MMLLLMMIEMRNKKSELVCSLAAYLAVSVTHRFDARKLDLLAVYFLSCELLLINIFDSGFFAYQYIDAVSQNPQRTHN